MLNAERQRYLAAMGIDVWISRHQSERNPEESFYKVYELLTATGRVIGQLYLERWENSNHTDEKIYHLLNAMFAGIGCQCKLSSGEITLKNEGKVLVVMQLVHKLNNLATQSTLIEIEHPITLLNEPDKKRAAWMQLKKIQSLT